ncbi:serine hydrolase domain-containing protein [Thermocrispum sp.]|uniref:Serine hydrolase domain-containing protein n=1 Tax=Thermocrispum agreste TaxID=37925 RepID=A0ABD6FHT6_9PSEU|nr:serine hydrolase domain-containing protein [Thermocrispum sp.]
MRKTLALMVVAAMALGVTTAQAGPAPGNAGRYDRPLPGFSPAHTTLTEAPPEAVGLDPEPIEKALAAVRAATEAPGGELPLLPGAVTVLGHQGRIVAKEATGWALRYADGEGTELPADERLPMRTDTIFDMASVSKLFTSIVVMQLVEAGKVELDAPVARYVPEFAENGKEAVTVRQLLTHTSGLPAWLPLWSQYPDVPSRLRAALTAEPVAEPGTAYEYSDLNLIALGVLAERVSGKPLDDLVADGITGPLGMRDTGYNPSPALRDRIAATEYQSTPPRGMVHGEVHDENAWSLGGVAGHAGIFSTAGDMAVLAQALLNGGSYGGKRILSRRSVELMITNFTPEFPGDDHGLGFELNQRWYMSGLASPRTAGHTGFTGTSLVIDFPSRSFAILLTNRVHPTRTRGSINQVRRDVAQGLAEALAVRPRHGRDAWFSGVAPDTTATLDAPVTVPATGARLGFDLFIDLESTESLFLETSTDSGRTWSPVPFTVYDRGTATHTDGSYTDSGKRRWMRVRAQLEGGDRIVRWRSVTDATEAGRGVFVDGIRVTAGPKVLLDAERHPEVLTADGWRAVER